jgi:hypothetical protein
MNQSSNKAQQRVYVEIARGSPSSKVEKMAISDEGMEPGHYQKVKIRPAVLQADEGSASVRVNNEK